MTIPPCRAEPQLQSRHQLRRHPKRGFTALELLVTIAILGILTALAAPSFVPLMERWRTQQVAEQLRSTIYFARSEAIKRGGNVVLQKLPNAGDCSFASGNDEWGCGWFVCVDSNSNGSCAASEEVLQRYDTPGKVKVRRSTSGAGIKLNRWGLVEGKYPGFTIVPEGKNLSDPAARGICVSSGGRVRLVKAEDVPCNS